MPYRKAWAVAYRRERDAGAPGRYVDAGPTRARLLELAAARVPLRALARGSGLSGSGVKAILDGRGEHVQRATAQRVATLSLARVYGAQATGHVPRVGAVRRVQALMALGWPHDALAAAGAPHTANLLNSGGHLMTVERWRQVRDVYDRLSMTPGPSPESRGWARSLGYSPPLAWDDETIDDPTALPEGEASLGPGGEVVDLIAVRRVSGAGGDPATQLTAEERTEVVRAMAAAGASDTEIGERLGVVSRTVLRMRQREQIPPGQPRPQGAGYSSLWCEAQAATEPGRGAGDVRVAAPPRARSIPR